MVDKKYRIAAIDSTESAYFQSMLFSNGYQWQAGGREIKDVPFIFFDTRFKKVSLTRSETKFAALTGWKRINKAEFNQVLGISKDPNVPATDFEELW